MAEPATGASLTLASAAASVPVLTAFGIPLGLRPDILLAGFSGALAAIILLNSVPSEGDTWQALVLTTCKRFMVVLASSLTAGYITPGLVGGAAAPQQLLTAFLVGGGAQQVLAALIARFVQRTGGKP